MATKTNNQVEAAEPEMTMAHACGTHAGTKVMFAVIAGFIALFMLGTTFAVGVFVGNFHSAKRSAVYGYGSGMMNRGTTDNYGPGMMNRGATDNYGSGMMNRGTTDNYGPGMMSRDRGYGRGMMNDGQGYCYDEQDSTAPYTQELPAP